MAQIGRIGGPLLADNLLRNGNNLAFETKLLYLDVNNKKVGFNNLNPNYDLQASNGIDSVNLLSNNTSSISNFIISSNTISNGFSTITIQPNQSSNPTIVTPGLQTSALTISTNLIKNNTASGDINITANGSGQVILNNNTLVTGNLHATGNITFDGNIQLGSNSSDTITFTADVNSDILPNVNNTYTLGSSSLYWKTLYTNTMGITTINQNALTATTLNSGNISLNSNSISVAGNFNFGVSGTGHVKFNGFRYITGNTINNPNPTGAFNIGSTGSGYIKFSGSTGIVVPLGNSSTYPLNPQGGTMRYNTDTSVLEIYNNSLTSWLPVIGNSPVVSAPVVQQTAIVWDLILGL